MLLDISGLSGGGNEPMPRWLDEGLANYFEHGVEGGVNGGYADGEMPVPLDFLLKLKPDTFYDKEHGSDHYRESNLLVAFFMNDNDGAWRKDFLRFVRVSGRRYSDLAEVVVAAGLDEETFARRFKAWAMAAAEGFRVPEGAPGETRPAGSGASVGPKSPEPGKAPPGPDEDSSKTEDSSKPSDSGG